MRRRSNKPPETWSGEGRNPHFALNPNSHMYDYFVGYFSSNPAGLNLPQDKKLCFRIAHSVKGKTGRNLIQFSTNGRVFVDVLESDVIVISPMSFEALNTNTLPVMKDAQHVSAPPRFAEYLLYLFIPR